MNTTQQRFDELEQRIQDENFRLNRGKANEVNYWIFDYPPEDELVVRERISNLVKRNQRGRSDYTIFEVDLYDFIIDELEKKGFLEKCYQFEEKRGIKQITRAVENFLKINSKDSVIVEYIKENAPDNAIVFLTGIGKAYPLLRSHKILNTLGQAFDSAPVILFFPGNYDQRSLKLFNTLQSSNYYRAFKLVN